MLTAISTEDRLFSAAESAGLKRTRGGLFGPAKGKADWEVNFNLFGTMSLTRPHPQVDQRTLLMTHGDWCGPVKLQRNEGKVCQQIDMFFGPVLTDEQGESFDDEEIAQTQTLLTDILGRISEYVSGVEQVDGWEPPASQTLSDWLTAAGHEAAIDKDGNLRLAVKRRGCDGQIRVDRKQGRLRFSMPLGQWTKLEQGAEEAIVALAAEANSRSRLVRLVWIENEEQRRCEAQVDLSGLPMSDPINGSEEVLWKEMIRMAVDGLELALRRLGLELDALANSKNRELAELFRSEM